jgi:sigma-B regulation protein RsbU (phosphoserine phosphatase)
VEEQRRSAAAVERLESELRIAREIQMSFVPKDLEHAPETMGCDAFGILDPAREVGGDLFDMFRGQDGDIRFLIGDVSDKGIPAALFMAVTHTLLKGAARELREPRAILERVNADLAGRAGATMFVTLLCGSFDARSGSIRIACGGHTPAVIVPLEGPPRLLGIRPGTVIGVVPGIEIPSAEDRLDPGDTIVLYTDGVTEAMDPEGNLFGEERLLASLAESRAADARGTAERTLQAVRAFSNGAPQSDDIAILAIRRLRRDA